MSASSRSSRSYGSGARILSIGIASTGLLTFAYFSIASHVLGEIATKRIDLLWSVMFVVISVIYRPIEQLLSRTIADRRARGHAEHSLRVPIAIQTSFALLFLAVALVLHHELVDHVFSGYRALYDVLVVGTLAYAASYFARGWLAGHKYFALYGGLVLMESVSRICFRDRRRTGHRKRSDSSGARDRRRAVRIAGRGTGSLRAAWQRATRERRSAYGCADHGG